MISEGLYTFSELNALIKEGSEFKAKLGNNVAKDDAKNNVKAVDDIMKETEKLEKGAKAEKRKTNPEDARDLNKTTLDVKFAYEPSKEYKERVKAQVHGFPSKQNEDETDATDNEGLDFEGNKKFYDDQQAKSKVINDLDTELKHAGLKSRELSKEHFKNQTLFKENKTMKRLHFKNTEFLSESQMLSKVPEDYKVDGNKFLMKDSTGEEFIVECKVDDRFGLATFKVEHKPSAAQINEELNHIKHLYDYKSGDYTQTTVNKDTNEMSHLLNLVKNLQK